MGVQCEHLEWGCCTSCYYPTAPKFPDFRPSEKPWLVEFTGRVVTGYKTLPKAIVSVSNMDWKDFRIITPNGVRLSVEIARSL